MVDLGPLSPWKPSGAAVVPVGELLNPCTGQWEPCAPGTQIMADDLDWMTRGWEAVWLIEAKIREAERSSSTIPALPPS